MSFLKLNHRRVVCFAALAGCVPSVLPALTHAAESAALLARIESSLERTCFDCHTGDSAEAELDLRALPWKPEAKDIRQRWIAIHDRIAKREMPPDPESLPDAERIRLLAELDEVLHEADLAEVRAEGRAPLRRLNRQEFEENVRDVLRLPDLDVRDILPEDSEAHQSNKSASALTFTRVQLDAFLDAADAALRAAVASGVKPRSAVRYHALATRMFPKAVDHAGRESSFYAKNSRMIPLTSADLARIRKENSHDSEVEFALFRSANWPYYGYPEEFLAHETGTYRVRFYARAVRQRRDFRLQPSPVPLPMTFRARRPTQADVSGDVRATGGVIDVQPEGAEYETSVRIKRGETIEYSLLGLPVPFPITSHGGPLYYDFPPHPEGGHPGIAFRWIEITGPIDPVEWPPESHRVLFDDLPIRPADDGARLKVEVLPHHPRQDAARLLRRFAAATAHGEVPEPALAVYEQLIQDQLDSGAPFAEAMLAGYKAFLCSGHFLFLREPREADQAALAARLSHFLWNSRPDRALAQLAEEHQLRSAASLKQQADRLIQHPRFEERFITNFTDYWLELKELDRDTPDIRLYPEYRFDDYLIESMGWETRAFVTTLFRENLPISTLVKSDFAMLNDRLARHYELPKVRGSHVRKVQLPEWTERGGILTQAAVLKVTANGTTTSPVTRGAWVMDRIFGDPPPPPPPNVPAVEPDIRGAVTVREILSAHAADAQCAGCHAHFDPVGLALENFDILGGWRDRYRSLEKGDEVTGIDRAGHKYTYRVAHQIDSSGKLRDGRTFADIDELRELLAGESRQLARNLLQRLITYATGTPARYSDRREVEAILDRCREGGYRAGDLLHEMILSRIFCGGEGLVAEGEG